VLVHSGVSGYEKWKAKHGPDNKPWRNPEQAAKLPKFDPAVHGELTDDAPPLKTGVVSRTPSGNFEVDDDDDDEGADGTQ
jgi:hypothetical protein